MDACETPDTRLFASVAELAAPGRIAGEIVEVVLLSVVVLGEVVVEGLAGFLVAPITDTDGLVAAVLEGEEVKLLGTAEVRRAAAPNADFFFSSSDTDG